jgi:NAD(P)-dependent dehydrogenase (short-subunit alcohol dehydrogenase family)
MTTIMITGAGSGLNNGAALELARRGYDVIACVEIYPQVRALELQAKALGVSLRIEKIDVTEEGDRRRAASWDMDILVNGAGIIEGGAIVDVPAENMRRQFEVNVFGPVQLTQSIAKKMIARRSGKIIFMSSVVGILSGPFVGAYGASKHALEAIAETMAMELQEFGVEVATINPGPYLTGFNDAGFLGPKTWDDDPSTRVFNYEKLAFPFEQFEPSTVFDSIVDVITGKSQLFRNVVTPDFAEAVRQQSSQVWTRKTTDGLGTRAELVQRSYDLSPETSVDTEPKAASAPLQPA